MGGRALWMVALLMLASQAFALEPAQLLLLVNKNVPESRKLAQYYATKRHVPHEQIVELDLPDSEEVSFEIYETKVFPVVRQKLASLNGKQKITCLVSFYGVPLKLAARTLTADNRNELNALQISLTTVTNALMKDLVQIEAKAKEIEPAFMPRIGDNPEQIAGRAEWAIRAILNKLATMTDTAKRDEIWAEVQTLAAPLSGPASTAQGRLTEMAAQKEKLTPEQEKIAGQIREELQKLGAGLEQLQMHRHEPKARAALLMLASSQLGPIEHLRLIKGMMDYFSTENTDAAFDSELATIAWNFPTRTNSLMNPMFYRNTRAGLPLTYMTARLDGLTADAVQEMINQTLQAESDGLKGQVVVDAGGNLNIDPNNPVYRSFDNQLKAMADVVKSKTQLTLTLDEKKEIIPVRSLKDIALYTGWYQLRNYSPPGGFSVGAVGFHVASYEMCSLHLQGEKGWCKGLLGDGVVATIGAVNEPFLNAFPDPGDFFSLVMTGQVSLAECYWRTVPSVSWRMAMVGDPLYLPYKKNPAMKVSDLDPRLQKALEKPTVK